MRNMDQVVEEQKVVKEEVFEEEVVEDVVAEEVIEEQQVVKEDVAAEEGVAEEEGVKEQQDAIEEYEDISCILGCGNVFQDEKDHHGHLMSIHGYNQETMSRDGENFDVCCQCAIIINRDQLCILDHLLNNCEGTGAVLKEVINAYRGYEQETGIPARSFLRLDVEAYCNSDYCHECEGNDDKDSEKNSLSEMCSFHSLPHKPNLTDMAEHWINSFNYDLDSQDVLEEHIVQNCQEIQRGSWAEDQ